MRNPSTGSGSGLRTFVAVATVVATTVACGGGAAPELAALEDQEVAVGSELSLQLIGTDADGDELSYSFAADVPNIGERASVTRRPDGSGLFRWTPLAADVGPWFFDFTVSDGDSSDTVTIQIDVKSAVGSNGAPVFREPLGTGSTLDLAVKNCLELDVVVEDQDSASVVIAQDDPIIDGARLTSTSGLTAVWEWCPTTSQVEADDRYTLRLSADDLTNPKTTKTYLVVLRKPPKPDCLGDGPIITHSPMDESTLVNLTIDATVTDDLGLKEAPLFYYSTTPVSDPPDLGAMTQVSMVLLSGDMRNGTWAADVPNPVAGSSAGTMADLHYVIAAQDNDDAEGDCDHLTQAPQNGAYTMTVTNPGGSGGAGICQSCSADVQCGGAADLCVRVGTGNEPRCLEACSGPSDCPTNYTCSASPVTSVNGASARQCVPNSNDCSNPGGTVCTDDSFEDNDSIAQANANPILPTGTHNLTSCPVVGSSFEDDEDFFRIQVTADSNVTLNLMGSTASDLDLRLYGTNGTTVLASSLSLSSTEQVMQCLTPGIYYVRVNAVGPVENDYTLSYARTAMSCAAVCVDDDNEDDDDPAGSRKLTFSQISLGVNGPYLSETQAICSNDDDYYEVSMVDGDTLNVDLLFTDADGDLDLYLENVDGTRVASSLTTTDDEQITFTLAKPACTISAQCKHYVVVHGYNGAENLYDISIGLEIGN